ncbi:uncharacterized protein EI90DRAFT_2967752 [Cantharellus anzutake]|uniref:uncharacterized protein n=1 Tax=Cantharellus anzutake TaxID=1750568 RepID=UPI00190574AC|nr:uncharacterized protein EI90DRAFT_2967752 [Cantharellus anzutake]KAF8337899.1 hypothetical protein EI90DRAFT_2967752 [Cantharellus anzutake]
MFQVETAQELLVSLKRETQPLGPTCIDDLDDHIRRALPELTTDASTLNRGDVFEIHGSHGSGKTHLLYFIVMTCVLPYSAILRHNGLTESFELGGKEKAVIAVDCDRQWSTDRINELVSHYVRKRIEWTLAQESIEISRELSSIIGSLAKDISDQSLRRLHIFRPSSPLQLAATLASIPNFHATSTPDQEICMLMIDSLTAFRWPDLGTSEHNVRSQNGSSLHAEVPIKQVTDCIQALRESLGVVTFVTRLTVPALPPTQDRGQSLPSHYTSALDHPHGQAHDKLSSSTTHQITLFPRTNSPGIGGPGTEPSVNVEACVRTSVDSGDGRMPRARHRVEVGKFEFRISEGGLHWP